MRYNDPTGHDPCDNGAACGDPSYSPEIQALYDAFQATGPNENYTWDMFYADLLWSMQQVGGNLTTANYARMPELMETAFNARHGGTAPPGTAPYVFFFAVFRPDELYAGVEQAENQRIAQLAGVLAGLAVNNSSSGSVRYNGPKPRYDINEAHNPRSPLFNPRKTPLPADAEEVYAHAVPGDPNDPRTWWGLNADGQVYRYSSDNAGTAHFSGIVGVAPGVENFTSYAKQRLGVK